MKLWCRAGARALRPLWALEEMGLEYELEILPFPPRIFERSYESTAMAGVLKKSGSHSNGNFGLFIIGTRAQLWVSFLKVIS